MTLDDIYKTNLSRVVRWHPAGLHEWSALEWAGAMAGEAGEACNAAKKLKRIESGAKNINEPSRSLTDLRVAREQVAKEVADTIIYGLLLMAAVGVKDPSQVVREVFNKKSEEYGFPERL